MAKLNQTIEQVTDGLEKYDIGAAGKALEVFTDDLSRWYIRRSRSRLQKSEDQKDFESASATLHYCLLELSKLLAPFTPFFAEALFQSLNNESGIMNEEKSVHLQDWAEANKKAIDYELLEKMEEVRRLSSLALALRAERGIEGRQPVRALEVRSKKLDIRDVELVEILKDEVNVKSVEWNMEMEKEVDLDTEITPELKEEGLLRELVRMVQGLRHDANYVPKDEIALMIEAPKEMAAVWERQLGQIKKAAGAKSVEFSAVGGSSSGGKKSEKFDAEINSKLDGQPIWVGVRKI